MKSYYWICPTCGNKVELDNMFYDLFDENGEAEFDVEFGVPFYVIKCDECGNEWVVSFSGIIKNK